MSTGRAGICKLRAAGKADNASAMAFITAGGAALAPASPQPFAPNTLVRERRPLSIQRSRGISAARGNA